MIDEAKERALFAGRAEIADEEMELDVDDVLSRVGSRRETRKTTLLARANRAAAGLAAVAACFAVLRGLSGAFGLVPADAPIVRDSARAFDSTTANGVVPACGLFSSPWDTSCETTSGFAQLASEDRATCEDTLRFSPLPPSCSSSVPGAVACGVDVTCSRVGP
jgi:hypothetical protein